MSNAKVCIYAVYEEPEEGWDNIAAQFDGVCGELEAKGIEVMRAPCYVKDQASAEAVAAWARAADCDLLYAIVVTWSFDQYSIDIRKAVDKPIIVRAMPGIRSGSLVGAQQLCAVLYNLELPYCLMYGDPGSDACGTQAAQYIMAAHLKNRLQSKRILMMGRRTPGMTPTAFEEQVLMKKLGVTIGTVGMDEMEQFIAANADDGEAERIWDDLVAKAESNSCDGRDGVASVRGYLGIRKYLKLHGYDAVSIGCYPDCQGTMCLPIALLSDDRIVAGCEGDMTSTVAMLILSMLSGSPIHFGEMLAFDDTNGSLISSHCGAAALCLSDDKGYNLCQVRLANSGVCVRHCCHTGDVTYVNLLGSGGKLRMCVLEGAALPTEMVFEGNPLRIKTQAGREDIIQAVAENGFSHHWMTAYGHVADVLEAFCKMTGILFVKVDQNGITRRDNP